MTPSPNNYRPVASPSNEPTSKPTPSPSPSPSPSPTPAPRIHSILGRDPGAFSQAQNGVFKSYRSQFAESNHNHTHHNFKMLAKDLLKDLAFPDSGRLLQQTGDSTGDSTSGGSDLNIISGMYIVGLVLVIMLAIGCYRIVQSCVSRRRVHAMGAPELPHDKKLGKTPKSTLATRKQATLELFETSQVTMKVTEDDIHEEEEGCIEDIETGFDEGGILKLSRQVTTSSNSTLDASSSFPPEWSEVPNLCAICLDSYQPGEVVAWSIGCRHAFHQDCISHYLAKKMIGGETPCPSCRQKFCDLPEEPLIQSSSSNAGNSATTSESTEARLPSV